jgi:hypothetical protein
LFVKFTCGDLIDVKIDDPDFSKYSQGVEHDESIIPEEF